MRKDIPIKVRFFDVNDRDNILIIAPHPDDESIGVGGLLLSYPNQCEIVVLTDGSKGDKNISVEKMREIRRKEFLDAMSQIGITRFSLLDYLDGELIQVPDCLLEIDFNQYTKIIIPDKSDAHADHVATYKYAISEIKRQGITRAEIYQYETRGPSAITTHVLDITEKIKQKQNLIRNYHSQIVSYDYAEFARALADYHACKEGNPGRYYESYSQVNLDETDNEVDETGRQLAAYRRKNDILNKWLQLKLSGVGLAKYVKHGSKVVVYGYGELGRMLCKDLSNESVEISYVLDRNADNIIEDNLQVYYPSQKYEDVDLVIVSNMFDTQSIIHSLQKMGYDKIVTLWDVLVELS